VKKASVRREELAREKELRLKESSREKPAQETVQK
jgi:hypothetical protein